MGKDSVGTPAGRIIVVVSNAPPDGGIRRLSLAAYGIESGSAPTGRDSA